MSLPGQASQSVIPKRRDWRVYMFVCRLSVVMPAHSRPKDGVPSHAYVAGIHVFLLGRKTWMAGTSPAMTPRMWGRQASITDSLVKQPKLGRPVSLRRRVRRRLWEEPLRPEKEPKGARDARGPIGPAGLDASRHRGLSKSLWALPSALVRAIGKAFRKSAKPKASRARCL